MRVLLGFLVLFPAALFSQSLDDELHQIYTDANLMGLSVAIVCEGEIDQVFHLGLKDYTRQLAIDDSTMFRVASISKAVTATGAMMLVEEGLLDLDADISTYLGFEARNPLHPDQVITSRMLLSHLSSMQDGAGYAPFLDATYNAIGSELPSMYELLHPNGDYFTSNMWRTEPPGSYFTYSNLNYGVLATIMEAVTGARFDQLMDELLFDPMGLACTYNVADIENIDNLAVCYRNQGGWAAQVDNFQGVAPSPPDLEGYVIGSNGVRFAPQGGLRCSAVDLAKIMMLHLNAGADPLGGQLLSPETIQSMQSPAWTYDGSNGDNYYGLFNRWGLGLHLSDTDGNGGVVINGRAMAGHPGEAYGLISDMYFDLNTSGTSSGLIFITNGKWSSYSFGAVTSFYQVEEDVFNAISTYSSCIEQYVPERSAEIEIYPMPARSGEEVFIPGVHGEFSLSLVDTNGKITELMIRSGWVQLPLLDSGMYILRSTLTESPFSQRLIVIQ